MSSAFNIQAEWAKLVEMAHGETVFPDLDFDGSPDIPAWAAIVNKLAAAPTPPVDAVPGEPVVLDGCELCNGRRGGVPGNENIIDGKRVCDYCHSDSVAVPGEPVAGDRVRRLAEDWAEDCVWAGYVTTIKCKSYRHMVDAINSLAASVAPRAGSEPVPTCTYKCEAFPECGCAVPGEPEERMFDLTLECVGRTVDVTFSRPQIDALIARLREFGLLAPIAPAAAAEPSEPVKRCSNCDDSGQVSSITGEWHGRCHCEAGRSASPLFAPDRERAASLVASEGLSIAQEPKYTVNGSAIMNRASGEAIPADEPVFIFRARDVRAVGALSRYASVVALHSSEDHWLAVMGRIDDFVRFRRDHPERMKEPDTDRASAEEAQS
jgi:hypothetical protein